MKSTLQVPLHNASKPVMRAKVQSLPKRLGAKSKTQPKWPKVALVDACRNAIIL